MITNAEDTYKDYVQAGADYLTVHVEACPHIPNILEQIRKNGIKSSVTLRPDTPLEAILTSLPFADMVLVMSVNPGFGGQAFIPSALDKARELLRLREKKKLSYLIEMDGGIKTENIATVSQSGVDVFVVGSGIFKTPDYKKTIQEMKNLIKT